MRRLGCPIAQRCLLTHHRAFDCIACGSTGAAYTRLTVGPVGRTAGLSAKSHVDPAVCYDAKRGTIVHVEQINEANLLVLCAQLAPTP